MLIYQLLSPVFYVLIYFHTTEYSLFFFFFFFTDKYIITETFDYLHNEMNLSHAQLLQWPKIFRTRLHRIKERHQFLKHMKRHQYDSTKENYVSLKALVSDNDKTFCFNIAKTSTTEFNQFLKTL